MSKRDSKTKQTDAFVRIIEQPAPKALRFRYKCEGRSAGSIPGVSSTPEHKTYPSIQVVGFQGKSMVVVSCVTKDYPYRPHPHHLVGREGCKRGVCLLPIPKETMSIQFTNLGIQCVKKAEIEASLNVREEQRIDPFQTGFNHKEHRCSIDLSTVRLCFQVLVEGKTKGKFNVPLPPVVSEPIYDKKAKSDLVIIRLSDCVSYANGDPREIILLCEKIAREDIQVRFFEVKDGVVVWESFGDFLPSEIHKQCAISFRPPRYYNLDIQDPVKVWVQLKRPSDGATSDPLPFEFLPLPNRKRKRPKFDSLDSIGNPEVAQMRGPPIARPNPIVWNIPPEIPSMMLNSTIQYENIVRPEGCIQQIHENINPNIQQDSLQQVDINSEDLRLFEQDLEIRNLSETLSELLLS